MSINRFISQEQAKLLESEISKIPLQEYIDIFNNYPSDKPIKISQMQNEIQNGLLKKLNIQTVDVENNNLDNTNYVLLSIYGKKINNKLTHYKDRLIKKGVIKNNKIVGAQKENIAKALESTRKKPVTYDKKNKKDLNEDQEKLKEKLAELAEENESIFSTLKTVIKNNKVRIADIIASFIAQAQSILLYADKREIKSDITKKLRNKIDRLFIHYLDMGYIEKKDDGEYIVKVDLEVIEKWTNNFHKKKSNKSKNQVIKEGKIEQAVDLPEQVITYTVSTVDMETDESVLQTQIVDQTAKERYEQFFASLMQAKQLYLTLPDEFIWQAENAIQGAFPTLLQSVADDKEYENERKRKPEKQLVSANKKATLTRNDTMEIVSDEITNEEKDIEFDKEYEIFSKEILDNCSRSYDDLLKDSNKKARFMAMNKLGMSYSITYIPKKAESLRRKEKNNKRDSNTWSSWPLASQKGHHLFRQPLSKYRGFTTAQLGSLTAIPITASVASNHDYIFVRSEIYNNKNKRIEYLNKIYLPAIKNKNHQRAANCLFMLFEHIGKQIYFLKKEYKPVNITAFIVFINEEIKKLGFDEVPAEVRTILRKKFNAFYKPEKPEIIKKTPVRKMENDVNEIIENGVSIRWVKKKREVGLKEKIDIVNENDLVIDKDVDLYDADTGVFILSFRKDKLQHLSEEIKTINTYMFMTDKRELIQSGVIRDGDKADPTIHPTKLVAGSLPTGFLFSKKTSIPTICSATTGSPYAYEVETAKGKIAAAAEAFYEEMAPEEYKKVAEIMEEYNEFLIPDCKISVTGEFNFDKQTLTHKDPNQFPEKSLAVLTVFNGGECERYEGGDTYFVEYGIAIRVKQKDLLLANFEQVIHCNTKINITDANENVWHRVPLIIFTRGELFSKVTPAVVCTSDDECDMDPEDIEEAMKTPPKKQGDGSQTMVNMLEAAIQQLSCVNSRNPSTTKNNKRREEELSAAKAAYIARNQRFFNNNNNNNASTDKDNDMSASFK